MLSLENLSWPNENASFAKRNRTNPDGSGYESLFKNTTNDRSEFLLSYASSFKNDYLSVQFMVYQLLKFWQRNFNFIAPATGTYPVSQRMKQTKHIKNVLKI